MASHLQAVCAALFVLTSSLAAQMPFRVEPVDPTSRERVTLTVFEMDSCPPPPKVTIAGWFIRVDLGVGPCLSPPTLITHRVDLGRLSAGTYQVSIYDGNLVESRSLVVLNANESVVVRPAVGPSSGGTRVEIFADYDCPEGVTCPAAPSVTFGGVPATNVVMAGHRYLLATTPPHAPGPVEVQVSRGATYRSFAFRYYDPAAAPLAALFEKILIPVIYDGPGAMGSLWQTEIVARNVSAVPIERWRGPGQLEVLPPSTPLTLESGSAPRGIFVVVPRDVAPLLQFGALVRDLSRQEREWGTELPIVREREFRTGLIELLNVPTDPRFRLKLRIYSLVSYGSWVGVTVYAMDGGKTLSERSAQLMSSDPCPGIDPCTSVRPAYAEIDDLPGLIVPSSGRVGIRIHSSQPAWAMVTVTNNETQHATVISPQ